MSDKIETDPLEKEKDQSEVISLPSSPEATVSNGLENEKPEPSSSSCKTEESTSEDIHSEKSEIVSSSKKSDLESTAVDLPSSRSKSRKSSLTKDSESLSEKMTNKDVPPKPLKRSRMRSRSKSSNSEDLKSEKAPSESSVKKEPESSDKSSPTAEIQSISKSNNFEDLKLEKDLDKSSINKPSQEFSADSPSKPDEPLAESQNSPLDVKSEKENEDKLSSDDVMEVYDSESQSADKGDDSGAFESISTPMIVEDDNISDFFGFNNPEDKYSAFSIVLRPYEEVPSSKKSSQNGPISSLTKFLSVPQRIAPIRSSPSSKIDINDPEFKKPFDYGWRRELVFRSTNENSMRRNADVYYYTPLNKKVRSLREVLEHLIPGEGLSAENFTFCKESVGVNDPEKEIIREANWKPSRPSEDGFYTLPVKKTTPKSKAPPKRKEKKEIIREPPIEIISPSSSPGTSTTSPLTPRIVMKTKPGFKVNSKKMNLKVEKRRKAAGPDDSSPLDPMEDWCPEPKAQVREVCSIECRLAMGLIPTLQCSKCLCLYHPECVNLLEAKERQIHSYVCKYCQNEAKQAPKLPPPPPLTPILSPQPQKKEKEAVKAVTQSPIITNATNRAQSIVGAVTTWLPPASSIIGCKGPPPIAPRPELESTPQSLISVQGKKYVVIPKVNRVKLDGRGEGGGADEVIMSTGGNNIPTPNPASVYLVPYNVPSTSNSYVVQTPNASAPTYIVTSSTATTPGSLTNGLKRGGSDTGSGSDGSPPSKMSAVSPKSAPSVRAVSMSKSAPKVEPLSPTGPLPIVSTAPLKRHTTDFMNMFNSGYVGLLHAFQYLKVHELLRAACVCKMWRHLASHRSLWEYVHMKNSRVRNWEGFAQALRTNGTRGLDLKKMLVPDNSEAVSEMWKNIIASIKAVPTLTKIDLGRCTPENVDMVVKACPQIESIAALSIRGQSIDLNIFKIERLVELKLKSVGGMDLNNFSVLKKLTNLKHLSLTSVKRLIGIENNLPLSLETLELGECCHLNESFATEALPKLKFLKRLRLEKGQGQICPTIQIINTISNLEYLSQLELINFDIKPGFDKALSKCAHIRTLLIIPTYVTQSATTNHVVMGGVTKLSATLQYFIWGLTLELLRVTDLFIDQVEGQKQKAQAKKGAGDSIPILKPLSDESAEPSREGQTTSQVDILALPKLQRVLSTLLPTTRIKILKVPFSATWRQIVD